MGSPRCASLSVELWYGAVRCGVVRFGVVEWFHNGFRLFSLCRLVVRCRSQTGEMLLWVLAGGNCGMLLPLPYAIQNKFNYNCCHRRGYMCMYVYLC